MKWLSRVNQALFGYGSPVTIGVIRIFVGTLAFVNLAMVGLHFESWFTEKGFVPVAFSDRWAEGVWRLNLLSGVTDARVTLAFYLLVMVAALFTAFGLLSRVSSIVLFVGVVSLHHRTPDILHSGDTLMRMLCFYVMLAPSGAACSLDRLIGLWRGTASKELPLVSLWPQRLVQFQVVVVYLTTIWHKAFGTTWRDGTATWYVPRLEEFDRFWAPAFVDERPWIMFTTYGTLVVQLSVATLAFSRSMRKWVLLAGIMLHAAIDYRFNIPLFGWIMVSTYIAFYSGEEVTGWAKRLGERLRRFRVTVARPQGTQWVGERGEMLRAADPFGLVEYGPGTDEGWSVTDARGGTRDPARATLARAPGLWFLCLWPPFWRSRLTGAVSASSGDARAPDPEEARRA